MKPTKKRIHQMTIAQWEAAFPDEDACYAYLRRHRWPEGVVLPALRQRQRLRRCDPSLAIGSATNARRTGYRFSDLAGTIFENTNKPLREWFRVIHMMLTSKKGVSALQVHRIMGFGSYKTALVYVPSHPRRAGGRRLPAS